MQPCMFSHVEFLFAHYEYATQSRIQFRNHVLHGFVHSIELKVVLLLLFLLFLNGGIMMCLDTYYDINSVRQHNCFYYTR